MQLLSLLMTNFRWIAAGFLLTMFSTVGQTVFIGLSSGHIRAEYGLSHGRWGTIYMAGTLASALTLPYLGPIVDRMPVRRVVLFVVPMLALGAVAMAVSSHVALLILTIYLLRLFGQGMMPHTAFTATARWFSAQRGKALSLVVLGHNTGDALFTTAFVALAAWIGWRNGWLVAAAALVLVALPLAMRLAAVERSPSRDETAASTRDARDWTRAEVLRDPIFYLAMLGALAPGFIVTVALFHQVYLVELRGWSMEVFASAFIVWALVNSVFALLSGQLIDRYSGLSLLPFVLLPLGAACILLGVVAAPWAPFAFMALVGMSNGLSTTLFGAIWPEVYGTKHLGAVRSLAISASVLATAAGPGLTGYLIDAGVHYPSQLVAMGLYCGVACLVLGYVSSSVRRRNVGHGAGSGQAG